MGCGSSSSKGSPDEQMANKKIEENLQQEKKIFIKISNCCCWVLGNLENQQLQNK